MKLLLLPVGNTADCACVDRCTNGEVYNMAIRGGNEGGLDGIDVWGSNIWVHDVMVTNKDECVTVKSPASDILVENIYCNWSGGKKIPLPLSTGGNKKIQPLTNKPQAAPSAP